MNHLSEIELVLALDGEMEEAELKRAVDHLAECDECRGQWEKLRGLSARVAEYSVSLYPQTSKPLAADGRRLTLIESKKGAFVLPFWKWGFAAIAAIVLTVGISMWVRSGDSHPVVQVHKPSDEGGAQANGENQKQVPLSASGSVQNDTSVKRLAYSKPLRKTPAAAKPDATLAQFTELPFSDASLPLEDATVVRVTLPASALRQAGVVVSEDNASAMLQADVVLGLDGLPRGIRLVKNGGTN